MSFPRKPPRHLFFTSPTPTPHIFYVIDFIWYYAFDMSDARKTVPNWQHNTGGNVVDDSVNQPTHYTDGGIETIDFIRAKLSSVAFEGYCVGNVIKYLSRYNKKTSNGLEDLQKAEVYLKWAIKEASDK
jgi:hypothetical protein